MIARSVRLFLHQGGAHDRHPPTQVDDVFVRGQRRGPGGAFPAPPSGGGGAPGDLGGVHQDELDPNPEPPPVSPPHPCEDPDTALDWNADAAGAEAGRKFLQKAGEIGFADAPNGNPSLRNREFGAFILRGPGSSVHLTPVTAGLAGSPSDLDIELHNTTAQNYQGDAHSHPFGDP